MIETLSLGEVKIGSGDHQAREVKEKAEDWSYLEREGPQKLTKLGQLLSSSDLQEMNHTRGQQSNVTHSKRVA